MELGEKKSVFHLLVHVGHLETDNLPKEGVVGENSSGIHPDITSS